MTIVDPGLLASTMAKAQVFTAAKAAGPQETIDILVKAGVITDKPWWQSAGINGSAIGAVSSVVMIATAASQIFGWTINPEVFAYLTMGIVGLGSSILTWWGRLNATQPINRDKVAPGLTLGER